MGERAMIQLVIFKESLSIYSICSFAMLNCFVYLIFTYVRFLLDTCRAAIDVLLEYIRASSSASTTRKSSLDHSVQFTTYQAGHHYSATKSGVDLLPFMLSVVISIVASGQLVGR